MKTQTETNKPEREAVESTEYVEAESATQWKTPRCYRCGGLETQWRKVRIWFHGDQDDFVCNECEGDDLEHIGTCYDGMKVFK